MVRYVFYLFFCMLPVSIMAELRHAKPDKHPICHTTYVENARRAKLKLAQKVAAQRAKRPASIPVQEPLVTEQVDQHPKQAEQPEAQGQAPQEGLLVEDCISYKSAIADELHAAFSRWERETTRFLWRVQAAMRSKPSCGHEAIVTDIALLNTRCKQLLTRYQAAQEQIESIMVDYGCDQERELYDRLVGNLVHASAVLTQCIEAFGTAAMPPIAQVLSEMNRCLRQSLDDDFISRAPWYAL